MPLKNIELIKKSTLTKGMFPVDIDFAPEEADQFIDYIIDESELMKNARVVRMNKPTKNIRTIGITDKVLWPDVIFDSTKYLKTTAANKDILTSKKARGAVRIHDDDLEDNIEGEAFVDHLMRMVTVQIAHDLEEGYWAGKVVPNGVTPLDLNGLWDGWRHRALTQVNTVTGAATILDARSADFALTDGYISEQNASAPYNWEFKFAKAIKSMPSKYKKLVGGLSGLRFFMSDQLEQDYIDSLAARSSILGDKAILGEGPLHYGKVAIVPCPLMDIDEPVAVSAGGDTVLTANVLAGAITITVAATGDFLVGDTIWFHKVGLEYKEETVVIDTIPDATHFTLKTGLKWAHTVAEVEAVTEVTLDGADCMLTHKDNLVIGIQRDIKMESQRVAAEESTYFFYSLRTDLLMGNPAAVVFIKNLKSR